MNLQQLEYIIAVDTHRHFVTAAEKCFITQATLSMMIKKLEDELEVKIFDRSKQPVVPTETGIKILAQAREVVAGARRLKEIVQEENTTTRGELRVGIIPTLAPSLLPFFISKFLKKYPEVKLKISELTTETIIQKLEEMSLDVGILATPLGNSSLEERPLFYEQFVVFASEEEKVSKKKYLLPTDIDINRLWLLEEGHCLRNQVINLCELKEKEKELSQLDFEAGSIETLKKLVEANQGITILPELSLRDMTAKQKKNIRYFKSPAPVREISIVTYRHFMKKKLIDVLTKEILQSIPQEMTSNTRSQVVEID